MTLFLFPCFPSTPSLSFSLSPSQTHLRCSFKPISSTQRKQSIYAKTKTPATDRIIDFGKYKGRMLGTLPSKYLKWVSKTLRARDFEEWATLADQVLQDPVYKDRIEWEFAQNILNGGEDSLVLTRSENPVSDLLEISDRFGWDNEDKTAWSRVDFALLGTSKGGRIPRIRVSDEEEIGGLNLKKSVDSRVSRGEQEKMSYKACRDRKLGSVMGEEFRVSGGKKVGFLSEGFRVSCGGEEGFEGEIVREKREERRERQRLKRGLEMGKLKREVVGSKEDEDGGRIETRKKLLNPFPGRGALLRKVNPRD